MTQSERREYLIQYLLKEERRLYGKKIPADKQGQENLLRSLMNVRPPKPISGDFLKIQDEYRYCRFKTGWIRNRTLSLAGRYHNIKM